MLRQTARVRAHIGMCLCLCFCASDAHDFLAECFIGCRQIMRRRRVTATHELQHDVCKEVLRARCACARHVACNMVGSVPVDDGWCGQSDHSGKIAQAPITFSDTPMLRTHSLSNFKHVVRFECHDFSFEGCLQLCWVQNAFDDTYLS